MKKFKSDPFAELFSGGTVVEISENNNWKSISEYEDKAIGKIGTKERDDYERELKMETIQELIKSARKMRNLSQQELGNLIGVNKAHISKLEHGYSNTSIQMVAKVFEALNAKVRITVELEDNVVELI